MGRPTALTSTRRFKITACRCRYPRTFRKLTLRLGVVPAICPVSERLARRILALPIYTELASDAGEYVISRLEVIQCPPTKLSKTN